ncbi:MAG: hypothetical protein KY429_11710 [Actinobacteria bacterium]|nr:hypothetical protein [Actinomycetota bacterium]
MVQKHSLKAVFDDDLEGLLQSLGLLGDFKSQRIRCAFCGDVILWENLYSVFPDSGSVKVSCSKPSCVKALAERLAPPALQDV